MIRCIILYISILLTFIYFHTVQSEISTIRSGYRSNNTSINMVQTVDGHNQKQKREGLRRTKTTPLSVLAAVFVGILLFLISQVVRHYYFACCNSQKYEFIQLSQEKKWQTIVKTSSLIPDKLKRFSLAFSYDEYVNNIALLSTMTSQLEHDGILYFLYGDAMIGAQRHHDIIPWSQDIHLLLDHMHKDRATGSLGKLWPDFMLDIETNENIWRFYSSKTNNTEDNKMQATGIQVIFYEQKQQSLAILGIDQLQREYRTVQVSDIFPLQKRNLGLLQVWVPGKEMKLPHHDKIGVAGNCTSHLGLDPTREDPEVIPCHDLIPYYPFVQRQGQDADYTEWLIYNNKIIGSNKWTVNMF